MTTAAAIWGYLTTFDAPAASRWVLIGLGASLGLLAIGSMAPVALFLLGRYRRPVESPALWAGLGAVARYGGLVWSVLFFLRYEAMFPFVIRIWVYGVAPFFLGAIGYVVFRHRRQRPRRSEAKTRYEHFERYLPDPKKH